MQPLNQNPAVPVEPGQQRERDVGVEPVCRIDIRDMFVPVDECTDLQVAVETKQLPHGDLSARL